MIYGAILAGGIGTRMHVSSMPKQFLPLNGKPIIIHTLEKMLACSRFDAVYLGIHPSWMSYMYDLLDKYNVCNADKIRLAPGGETRNDTIFKIIDEIKRDFGENEDDIIVTHDAVRPFVTLRILEENIDAAVEFGACDTVVPATDTIVCSEDGEEITDIPHRELMYQGQTPQSFKVKMLKELYAQLTDTEKEILTDACKICVMKNVPVKLIKGEILNIKITTVHDYQIAEAIAGGIKID
ncbi:MAG: 2-C-methyl-D-erythritol 4-phosphate cytidylyltransferase [Acutalibacteraceae bacterium]|nr:2-C-methyl-D-erythritol 4-phosphate cytidylyltransferase [Acutalibacteraceae bacterium]